MKNTKEDALFAWLTEENNPAVTYRTKTEILREKSDACYASERALLRNRFEKLAQQVIQKNRGGMETVVTDHFVTRKQL